MNKAMLLRAALGSVSVLAWTNPAFAQDEPTPSGTTQPAPATVADDDEESILVTAQRRAQLIQDVPISVSAFSGEQLERQQIENAQDLQLSLPNITYTKTNFTSSSFTIRGVGDLCTGFSCDQATGIHVNDMPLTSTRLFETEYFDLERIEVLRGPQGTLYGRNATSGVVNYITARPNLSEFQASAQAEYGNFDSLRLQGMVNVPIGDMIGVRVAGYWSMRDGMTRNLFDASEVDGRDVYALRGTIRIEPAESTTLDLIGYYFHERDDRSRIQKQMCNRDPTGVLGCSPDTLEFETVNGLSTLAATLTSAEFLRIATNPAFGVLGLNSVYGADPFYGGVINPADLRTVNIDFAPTYFAEEYHLMGRLEQELGDQFNLTVTGGYAYQQVDSRTDYNLVAGNSLANNPGFFALTAFAANPAFGAGAANPFAAVRAALIPGGPGGGACTSEVNLQYSGIFGGFVNRCTPGATDYDRSQSHSRQYSVEAHLDSRFDGPFNFLIGGIWLDQQFTDSNYYVASFGLDYASGILGAASTLGIRGAGIPTYPNSYRAPPFFNSEVNLFTLKSYGLFGEVYFDVNDRIRLTGGLRYSNDRKRQVARVPTLSWLAPIGVADATQPAVVPGVGGFDSFDADSTEAGNQPYDDSRVSFDEFTGRLVGEYRITPDNMVYASYSRGYKSGGINPPINPVFNVPRTFEPEIINAFEIGSRNTFADGRLRLNLSAFYYDYGGLQLSRIVARTSVNDNTDAEIYGAELEGLWRPTRGLLMNFSASYLHSRIGDLQLIDPRDVSGGRSDVVIIKDLQAANNCAVVPNTAGNAAGANALVGAVNGALGLRPPTPVPGTNTTGAFSLCDVLAGAIASPSAALRLAFATPTGPLPFAVTSGVPVDLSGNELPQAPNWKFSAGVQHTFNLGGGMTIVPRVDFSYTGGYSARSFNRPIDRISGYEIVNASVQLNARDDRWFVRAFVSNLTNNDAVTGLYLTDQSSGLFTNVFTLDPRRYGVAAGVRF